MLHWGNAPPGEAGESTGCRAGRGGCCPANNDEADVVEHGLLLAAPALTDMAACGEAHLVTLSWGMDGQISVIADGYRVRPEATREEKEPSSQQLFRRVSPKRGDPNPRPFAAGGATKHCELGRPLRPPRSPGGGEVSKKRTRSCQQLSEILKSSFSRVINIFHNHPKGVFPLH